MSDVIQFINSFFSAWGNWKIGGGATGCSNKREEDDQVVLEGYVLVEFINNSYIPGEPEDKTHNNLCNLENIFFGDKNSKLLARLILEKEPEYKNLSQEKQERAINILSKKIINQHSGRLYDLLSDLQKLGYISFCTTSSAWWTPTYGQPPQSITLRITTRDVKEAINEARNTPTQAETGRAPAPVPNPPKISTPPAPAITNISPNSVTVGDPGTTLTVTGSNFTESSKVTVSDENCQQAMNPVTRKSDTEISITINPSVLTGPKNCTITVKTEGGEASTTLKVEKKNLKVEKKKEKGVCDGKVDPEVLNDCNKTCADTPKGTARIKCISKFK